jgi:glycosyltransferase involved in cell wall biosynthesis
MTAPHRKIAIGIDASRAIDDDQTGTERYSRRIVQELLDLGTDCHFRLYVNGTTPVSFRQRADVEQRLIPFPRLWTHLRLSAELKLHPVDALFVPAHVVPPIHPHATVVTIHDLGYLHEPEAHTDLSRRYLDWSTRWSTRAAKKVIAISHTTRDDLIRHYDVPEDKITVIYHGVNERFRPACPGDVRRVKHHYGLGERVILFVGTIQPRKNLVRLIEAFDAVASDDDQLQLVLAGKLGWKTTEITSEAANSPFAGRILRPGHVDDDDLPALYSAARAVAFPSLYEGFGLPALEAMACGTPVLVSDRGSLPEIVGDSAVIVDPLDVTAIASGLRQILDEASRPQWIERGLEHASGFTWQRSGERTMDTILAATTAGTG